MFKVGGAIKPDSYLAANGNVNIQFAGPGWFAKDTEQLFMSRDDAKEAFGFEVTEHGEISGTNGKKLTVIIHDV